MAYFLIVLVPTVIIGTTVYLTRHWAPTSILTIVTWTAAWLVSMILVTVLYLLLIHQPNNPQKPASKQNHQESQQH
ncbi:hypothetical protein [Secundilactobacillus pentosiphilus]|uniref:hypothetical protein n=1 Tax=Secundilactobacillus pentosiphilus TaxID=1714682 RepID=UPI000F7B52B8|nr:hypothetical protein [Secundilactobacillus pentosiphilus]